MPVQMIDKLTMLRLEVSIWSARARLTKADIKDPSAMPPQAMATLGTKRLFDPTKMRIFNAIKARAVTLLDRNGARFLGGWATDIDKLPNIETELTLLANEFNDKVQSFFANYDADIDEWVSHFPEYDQVLRNAVPTKGQLQRKFGFNWQTFQITPTASTSESNTTKDAIAQLDNTAMEEVAKVISDIYNETFLGKEKVGKKSFRPFRFLTSKLQALSFIHPQFSSLNTLLSGVIDGYKDKCDDPQFCSVFKSLLVSLTTADGVRAIVTPFMDGSQTEADVMDAFSTPQTIDVPATTEQIASASELLGQSSVPVGASPVLEMPADFMPTTPIEVAPPIQTEVATPAENIVVDTAPPDTQAEELIRLSKAVLQTATDAINTAHAEQQAEVAEEQPSIEPQGDDALDSGGLW